jgi:flagellar biosynthetic protein FliR
VIEPLVTGFALLLARVATFVYVLPLLGGSSVPRTVKIGFALALTVLLYTSEPTMPFVDGAASWLGFSIALGREMLLGGMLGFAMSLFLLPAHVAAEFIAQEAGLSFASVVTATADTSTNSLTVFFELLASLVFFELDLHHVFLLVLQETLQHAPIGRGFEFPNWDLVAMASAAEEGGLLLAAPVALCLFLTTIVLALMTRAAPQLNLYTVGFPLRVTVCLGAMLLLMPQLIMGMIGLFSYFVDLMQFPG